MATQARLAGLESGKVGEVHMHMGNGKKGLSDVFAILEETEIPIKHFRPTHIQKVLEDGIKFANMGGYIDFTSASPTSAAAAIAKALPRVPFDRVTLSSDSNGSMPKWNEKNELIGIEVAKMTTLFECIKNLIREYDVPMEQALALVTRNVAQALEIAPAKGCITEGSDADLILLNEDLSFHTVMARGRIMMEEGIVKEKGYYS